MLWPFPSTKVGTMRSRPFASHNATSVFAALLIAIALLAAACGSDEPDTAAPVGGQTGNDTDGHDEFSFGEPAEADDADRVIDIDAADSLSFDPNDIEVEVGETVTFRVTNVGKLPHDFTIGDSDTQDDHEAEMAEMAEMPMDGMGVDDVNAMTMDPGETKDMTWTFSEAAEILMGCHIPGHYAGGMRGTIRIVDPS